MKIVVTLLAMFNFMMTILTPSEGFNIWHPGPRISHKNLKSEYDFIIVGAGSAGAVLAARLSEDPKIHVLLLEAGGREDIRNEIPMLYSTLIDTGDLWRFNTEPQNASCLGLKNRIFLNDIYYSNGPKQSFWPRGKYLGGTSSINGMAYTRGNRRDYDGWASLGNYGWSFEEVLPYFRKLETVTSPWLAGDTYYHGTSGPQTVSAAVYSTPSETAFLQGAFENGYPIRNVFGEIQTGSMPMMFTIRNGRRCSTNKAYLWPVYKRHNLHIMTHALVTKILINSNKQAYGVVFRRGRIGRHRQVHATKEVILSAGSINSPQLLMLSGVGPKAELEKHGIPVIADLPGVGENLQDHISPGGLLWTIEKPVAISLTSFLSPKNFLDYFVFGRGIIGSATGIEAVAYVNTQYANKSDDWPDVQVQYIATSPLIDRGITSRTLSGFSDETWNKYFAPVHARNTVQVFSFILRPKSIGKLRLRSTNPNDHPIIEPNYLSEDIDVKILIDGIKITRSIMNSTLFRQFGTKFIPTVLPGCEHHTLYSDSYWECLIRHLTITMSHTCGTTKMGIESDLMAVVNPELIVYGVKGLRVIDASVMPVIPSANTNIPVIMVAERGADLVKTKWNLKMN